VPETLLSISFDRVDNSLKNNGQQKRAERLAGDAGLAIRLKLLLLKLVNAQKVVKLIDRKSMSKLKVEYWNL
jgi:hypothetical protein